MIGDSNRDIEAGKNAGCKTISIGEISKSDYTAKNLLQAIEIIMKGKTNE